jgi:hypothetical protein
MKRKYLVVLVLSSCAYVIAAQSIPDSELIARIQLNKSKFPEWDKGANLKNKADTLGHDVTANIRVMGTSSLCDKCPEPDPANDPEVKRATIASDLIVAGHVTKNISALTQNEAFVFTDSEFVIDEIWKSEKIPGRNSQVSVGEEITITHPGGIVKSHGHVIRAFLSNHIPLEPGHSYLMYLRYLPDSRSYIPDGLKGFDVTESVVKSLETTSTPPAQGLMSARALFLQAMRASTNRAIEEQR